MCTWLQCRAGRQADRQGRGPAAIPARLPIPAAVNACMQVGTCSALTGLCTCPAGWTGFNCLHPMKRHCTHRHRRFGFEVPRLEPDPSLGVAGSEADWRFTRSHCSGGNALACGLWEPRGCLLPHVLPSITAGCLPARLAALTVACNLINQRAPYILGGRLEGSRLLPTPLLKLLTLPTSDYASTLCLPPSPFSPQATAMKTLLPASAPPTQPTAASQRRSMPCKASPWPGRRPKAVCPAGWLVYLPC